MDDEEVLLENDPLAIYLKEQQIHDFETTKLNFSNNLDEITQYFNYEESTKINKDNLLYINKILKSELLLEEDYRMLDIYYSKSLTSTTATAKKTFKIFLLSTFSLTGLIIYKYINLKYVNLLTSVCFVPILFELYNKIHEKLKNRSFNILINELTKFTNLIKKCIKLVAELSATINYYSSDSIIMSSINNVYIRFVKELYAILLRMIKKLVIYTTEISKIIPLTVENNLQHGMKEDLFYKNDFKISDLKLLFELYLLVQSDFIKTLGLTFCSNLWVNKNSNINEIIKSILPLIISSLKEKINILEKEYIFLRNYETTSNKVFHSPRKYNNSPTNYIISCLHNSELHFQQLLCKSRDLQNIIEGIEDLQNSGKTEIMIVMLNEMEKQLNSSKIILDGVFKYFNQIQNKSLEPENKVTMPQPAENSTSKTVEGLEKETCNQDKLIYELYIPKEGLNLTDLEGDTERPVFSMQDLDYSKGLLEELRTILKVRNPEIFEEQQKNKLRAHDSDSEDDDLYFTPKPKLNEVFRPTQPIGLAENLQTINQVLFARQNMLQNKKLYEETFGSTDDEEDADET